MKFVPFTSSTLFAGNTFRGVLEGFSELMVGAGFDAGLMVKVMALEMPPPGAGDTTVT